MVASHPSRDEPARLVFGTVRAGSAPNVIPHTAELGGTLRASSRSTWEAGETCIDTGLHEILDESGASFELALTRYAPPLQNDVDTTNLFRRAAERALGPGSVRSVEQSRGAEDFAWYLDHTPGAYCRLGVRPSDTPTSPGLHTTRFDIDEGALAAGIGLLVHVVDGFLRRRETQ